MKQRLLTFAALALFAMPAATVAQTQDNMKHDTMQQDSMKQDNMKHDDAMKQEGGAKTQKKHKTKKQAAGDQSKQDSMKHDDMQKSEMK